MTRERPYLLDVTRLVSRSWTRRLSTGIDRVCYAYLERYAGRAHAVVQHRGVARTFDAPGSDRLFELLLGPDRRFRQDLVGFAARHLSRARAVLDGGDALYVNVSHTDFDLPSHQRWVRQSRLRPVYLIHDLIPITHGELCRPHAVARHRGRVTGALRSAAGIIVNSHATARDLAAFSKAQSLPLPPTLPAALAGAPLAAPRARAPIAEPYFVCVGTIEPRKNHMLLLQVWLAIAAQLGRETPRLVIVGQWGKGSGAVREALRASPALQRHVTVMDRCPDEDLAGLVSGAVALLKPTLAEGFGLPLVEALRLGTPVIASDLPCFREIGQGVPTLLDPEDAHAWTRTVLGFASSTGDPERRRQLAMMPSFAPPTWDDHFARVEAWMERLPVSLPAPWTLGHRPRATFESSRVR
ncbi:glycosyltransferase family 1 protein [Novosphingobium sp. PC22D]|uniref:glycosyltransferase family 4 protein n=1 Tax=Novosphingobium sp. PC22D TaxID=1962403 RepID=UPI000BF12730|nr:glycosyltransferase family 1 protein [Novosphingobium sp. PC22D]